jgi:O-antigen/teichoic acid export membrane protein
MADSEYRDVRRVALTPIRTLRRLVASDDLLHHGSIMAGATVVSGGLNYAYQLFMGRMLGPEQYGVFGALFALFYLVNVLGRGVRFSATRFTTELAGEGASLAAFQREFLRRSFLFSTAVFVLVLAAAPPLSAFLDVDVALLAVAVVGAAPFGLALTANFGTLQGLQWFAPLGGYKILLAAAKLAFGVALVLLGHGVFGAFGALGLSSLVVFVVTTYHLRRGLPTPSTSLDFDYRRAYRYTFPAVLAGFCLTVPTTVDVILAKAFFPSRAAGLYAAASVLGKVLVFLPMGISTALFPKVSRDGDADAATALFDRAILYTSLIAGVGAAAFWLFPDLVLTAFYGPAYADAEPVLRWYGAAILAFALSTTALNFQLARDRIRFVYLFTLLSIVEIGLMWAFHGSLLQFVRILLVVNVVLFVVGVVEVKS